eukprot:9503798-Pyramimonas_sp.AAC.1
MATPPEDIPGNPGGNLGDAAHSSPARAIGAMHASKAQQAKERVVPSFSFHSVANHSDSAGPPVPITAKVHSQYPEFSFPFSHPVFISPLSHPILSPWALLTSHASPSALLSYTTS